MRHPEDWRQKLAGFAEQGWLNVAGGVLRDDAGAHPRPSRKRCGEKEPRQSHFVPFAGGIRGLNRFFWRRRTARLLVGERTNVIGSRKFRD